MVAAEGCDHTQALRVLLGSTMLPQAPAVVYETNFPRVDSIKLAKGAAAVVAALKNVVVAAQFGLISFTPVPT